MRVISPIPNTNARRPNALVVLNIALLSVLAMIMLASYAEAQPRDPSSPRARGEYTLVGGETSSGNSNAMYILDTANRELVAVRWNESTKTLEGIGYRDLSADIFAEPDR
jgi:hypothetical protein